MQVPNLSFDCGIHFKEASTFIDWLARTHINTHTPSRIKTSPDRQIHTHAQTHARVHTRGQRATEESGHLPELLYFRNLGWFQ